MEQVSFVKLTSSFAWPELVDGRISTVQFLQASNVVLKFFGKILSVRECSTFHSLKEATVSFLHCRQSG